MSYKKCIRSFILNKIKNDLLFTCEFSESCIDHYNFIVTHLINCKLLRNFNWKSKNYKKTRVEKTKNKLNILRNL